MFPAWYVKAKSFFLSPDSDDFVGDTVSFRIVKIENTNSPSAVDEKSSNITIMVDEKGKLFRRIPLFKNPWIEPIAPAEKGKRLPVRLVDHEFILREDENYDPNANYQLEVSTNHQDAISLSVATQKSSELSFLGIILAAFTLIFLYGLLIFEIVHRTLAAILGSTVAICCLTIAIEVKPQP